jgi:hypothetical protein
MAIDIIRVTEVLKNAILRELGDEVDLIFRYGSQLTGTTHKYSDIDISYTPLHEATWNSITVVVEDTMIDFYPIHWSQLEQMANFDNISCTVLLENQVVYQRTKEVGERFRELPMRLHALQRSESRPIMLRKAQEIFQSIGYQYYLLKQQAKNGHLLSCLQLAQHILKTVTHCLMICNQACIDTRKLSQVLSLPKLPIGFAETVNWVINTSVPDDILKACEVLLNTTRELLLAEQRQVQRSAETFLKVFNSAYPELKGDLQHLMLACERQDMYNFNLVSLYHELMIHIAQALTGIKYSNFNCIAEYEQNLETLGFPNLLPYVVAKDFDGLHRQCQLFDQHLQRFLIEYLVALNVFSTLDELQKNLEART